MSRYLTAARLREIESRLTPRDLAVIERVSSLRFVSGAQLARLHFHGGADPAADARAARRALLRLVGLDVLARLPRAVGGVRAGSAGFVYHLGMAGQRLALDRGWQPERRSRRSITPGQLFVAHALAVAELHTNLTEADRSRRVELLELVGEPACWRSYGGLPNQRPATLKPDSYARLGIGEYEDSYFFEIDRGTEGSRAIEGQLIRYLDYHRSGDEQRARGVFPRTLWLTEDQARADVIAASVRRLPKGARELFAVARFDELHDLIGGAQTGAK